jgi:uncharacterized protein (DUF1778 family)
MRKSRTLCTAMSRLTIDVTDQQHQALKAMAALEGKSIRQYALERLFPPDVEQAVDELRSLLAARLAEARRGELVEQSITAVAEDELQRGASA